MHLAFLTALIATLVLLWHYPEGRYFVTADSREVIIKNGTTTYDDAACKLTAVGHLVFFATGYPKGTIGTQTIFDGQSIALTLLQGYRHRNLLTQQNVDALADSWAARMKSGIEDYLGHPYVRRPPGGAVGVFIASLSDGSTYASGSWRRKPGFY